LLTGREAITLDLITESAIDQYIAARATRRVPSRTGKGIGMASRITAWAIDCRDGRVLADFWTAVLDWVIADSYEDGSVTIKPTPDATYGIDFFVVPDDLKRTKNRVHLDLSPTDRDQDAELARLRSLGARTVDIGQGDVSWHVLADPEGNEFCLLRRRVVPETD
jgi:predicted enzyme related to lactoylglutathione lyase